MLTYAVHQPRCTRYGGECTCPPVTPSTLPGGANLLPYHHAHSRLVYGVCHTLPLGWGVGTRMLGEWVLVGGPSIRQHGCGWKSTLGTDTPLGLANPTLVVYGSRSASQTERKVLWFTNPKSCHLGTLEACHASRPVVLPAQ